jgi:hypothetical protein
MHARLCAAVAEFVEACFLTRFEQKRHIEMRQKVAVRIIERHVWRHREEHGNSYDNIPAARPLFLGLTSPGYIMPAPSGGSGEDRWMPGSFRSRRRDPGARAARLYDVARSAGSGEMRFVGGFVRLVSPGADAARLYDVARSAGWEITDLVVRCFFWR